MGFDSAPVFDDLRLDFDDTLSSFDGNLYLLGSVTGSQVSAGSAAGSPALTGSISGTSTSTGSVIGVEGAQGVVTGSTTSTGSATGSAGRFGTVTGFSVNGGAAGGTPDVLGSVSGASTSSGSATGVAPTPSTPTKQGGGRRYYVQQQRPAPTIAAGSATGTGRSYGRAQGRCGHNGRTVGASTSVGACRGTSRLSVSPIRVHIDHDSLRRKAEDELLLLEI